MTLTMAMISMVVFAAQKVVTKINDKLVIHMASRTVKKSGYPETISLEGGKHITINVSHFN